MSIPEQLHSQLNDHIKSAIKQVFGLEVQDVHIEHPENQDFGDFSTNTPLVLATELEQSSMEIAKNLVYKLREMPMMFKSNGKKYPVFKNIEAASPGFINFELTSQWLKNVLFEATLREENYGAVDNWHGQKVMVEYTDPNPFKVFHVGHVMTNTIGESLARIFSFMGAEVRRANYQGDVGIHVANSIWGLVKKMGKDNLTLVDLERMSLAKRMEYLGQAYSMGAAAFEDNVSAKKEIQSLNNYIYLIAQSILVEERNWERVLDYQQLAKGDEPPFNMELLTSLYKAGKKWSLEYFETMYDVLGTEFDHYYFESQAGEVGWRIVMDHVEDGIFKKDQGAFIFEGEKYGLHTRVFVNSQGLPVYEAKDLGLATMKFENYNYDRSFIVTGNEVNEYFDVVFKALEQIDAGLARRNKHIGHGMMVFGHGKMSSRTGDVVACEELLDAVKQSVSEKMSEVNSTTMEGKKLDETLEKVAVGSIKYSILKSGIGHNIVYDKEKATNLQGNTGPYLQYTYTRTRSVLEKAGIKGNGDSGLLEYEVDFELSQEELSVLRHIYKFSEQVTLAGERLAPSMITSFVYDLAQRYNTFYAKQPIIKASPDNRRKFRLHLTQAAGQVINNSLYLLGIPVVDKM